MAKQRISKVLDTLETLGEIPKRAASEMLKTFNPLEIFNKSDQPEQPETEQAPKDHTPLNVEKVKGQHEVDDLKNTKQTEEQQKLAQLRQRLFRQVGHEQDSAIRENAQAEKQEKEQELSEEQRRQEELKRRLRSHQDDAPQGKEARGGLFGKKKRRTKLAAQENQAEMRGSGKH